MRLKHPNQVFSLAGLAGAATLFSTTAMAAGPLGVWWTEKQDARIEIAECGSALCGTIVWIKDPVDKTTGKPPVDKYNQDPAKRNNPIVGTRILLSMTPSDTNEWSGNVYNPQDGKVYKANLIMKSEKQMRMEGCLLFICMGETWTKFAELAPPTPAAPAVVPIPTPKPDIPDDTPAASPAAPPAPAQP